MVTRIFAFFLPTSPKIPVEPYDMISYYLSFKLIMKKLEIGISYTQRHQWYKEMHPHDIYNVFDKQQKLKSFTILGELYLKKTFRRYISIMPRFLIGYSKSNEEFSGAYKYNYLTYNLLFNISCDY